MKSNVWFMAVAVLLVASFAVAADGPAASQPAAPAAVKVVQDTPKALLESMHNVLVGGDLVSLAKCIEPAYEAPMTTMLTVMKDVNVKTKELAKVIEEKIGKDAAAKVQSTAGNIPSPLAKAVADGKIDWAKIKIEEAGETAKATVEGEDKPMDMKKVGGKWYGVPPQSEGMTVEKLTQQAEMMKGMMAKMIKGMDDVIKKIKDGAITKDNFEEEYPKTMAAAMMPQQP